MTQDTLQTEALEKLTKSSIELAEAASNYGALKVIFGVFLVVVIIIILMFLYQVLVLSRKVDSIYRQTQHLSTHIETAANRTVGHLEAQTLIRGALNNLGTLLKYHIVRIKYENHIKDEEKVKAKVNMVVDNNWNELQSFLAVFMYEERPLSVIVNEGDSATIKQLALACIYDGCEPMSIHSVDNQVNLFLEGLKITYLRNL
jgi:predicted Holliday junction resolvase-like endonuclease